MQADQGLNEAPADLMRPHKLSAGSSEIDREHRHPRTFRRQALNSGRERLSAGLSSADALLLHQLACELPGPFSMLYVLHTPRGEGRPGRYQSPQLTLNEVAEFLEEFGDFLGRDARCDFWLHCFGSDATLVWERHNLLYAYGPLTTFEATLKDHGFSIGAPTVPSPHAHHYHPAHDAIAGRLLARWPWQWSALRPEDEQ